MSAYRDTNAPVGNGRYTDGKPVAAGSARRKGPISGLVRAVAGGIGFASESYHHHKEKKAAATAAATAATAATAAQDEAGSSSRAAGADASPTTAASQQEKQPSDIQDVSSDSQDDDEASPELDEAAWQLDDAQTELWPDAPPDYTTATQSNGGDEMALHFLTAHQPETEALIQPLPSDHAPLALPVIIPQRRPGERSRGFIHAYAPVLEAVGVTQPTFSDFILHLNQASMPSPWINAINVASIAVQHVPEPVTIAVAIAARMATSATLQVHSRSKTNTFLNKINADFFRPRGLIAVILTWKPSTAGELVTQARFDAAIEEASHNVTVTSKRSKMKASHATTNFEWPASAPLVFPKLDKLATEKDKAKNKNKNKGIAKDIADSADADADADMDSANNNQAKDGASGANQEDVKKDNAVKRTMIFAAEYMDKRAQAQWAHDHPTSGLAGLGVKPEFHSRYSDPNHAAGSGSLIALLTGGVVGGRTTRRGMRRQRRQMERERAGLGIGPGTLIRGVKKFMHEDVLYLMVANMPSAEQMHEAEAFMDTQTVGS